MKKVIIEITNGILECISIVITMIAIITTISELENIIELLVK